jgi:hypothetical protein
MIRKPTLILLVVLALLIALAFYLRENPLPGASGSATPSPTAPVQVFEGINSSNIVEVSLQEGSGPQSGPLTVVTRDSQSAWQLQVGGGEKEPADTAKAEQLRAEIAALRSLAALPAGADLTGFGLQPAAYELKMRAGVEEHVVRIGKKTSIGTGYYVQVDGRPAMVVDEAPIDTIISLMADMKALETTPTVEGLITPALPVPAP